MTDLDRQEHEALRSFRKKPVTIQAMRWDGSEEEQAAIVNWSGGAVSGWFDQEYFLEVRTLEGTMRADVGDWIIRGVAGEFYPVKPDIFDASYEPAVAALAAREEPSEGALIEVEQLDTAGLVRVQLSLDAPAHLLSPGTAQDLGERLINAAIDVAGETLEPGDFWPPEHER